MGTSVAIAGAGLGGLTLARVLSRHGIPVTVYERDDSVDARSQGGQLDLHEHNGQLALLKAGLTREFEAIVHRGGAAQRVLARDGTLLAELPDDGSMTRPEALRGDIRRMLLDSLPDGTVRWGTRLLGVTRLPSGRHAMTFADGTTAEADLLVGADGAWSRVRRTLSAAEPTYAGMSYVDTSLLDVDARHPGPAAAVGAGAMYALTPGRGFLAHREPGDVIHVYVVLDRPLEWFERLAVTDPDSTRARLAAEFEGWAEDLRSLVGDSDTTPVVRSIHRLPDDHRWEPVPGVTLVGDAAHVTLPGGEGANTAMLDGAELAESLAAHPDDLDVAVSAYEQVMFRRAEDEARAARETIDLIFGGGAPHSLVALFTGAQDGSS